MKYFVALSCLCILTNCKKNKPDCGCNAQTGSTFSYQKGILDFDPIEKRYVILTAQFGGWQRNYICDSTYGNLTHLYRDGNGESVQVRFSGNVKDYCTVDTVSYIDIRKNIQLTSVSPLNP
jgi:hypothetical protein